MVLVAVFSLGPFAIPTALYLLPFLHYSQLSLPLAIANHPTSLSPLLVAPYFIIIIHLALLTLCCL